jgi:hypothetical protein
MPGQTGWKLAQLCHIQTQTLVVHGPTLGGDSQTSGFKVSDKINVSQLFNYQNFLLNLLSFFPSSSPQQPLSNIEPRPLQHVGTPF